MVDGLPNASVIERLRPGVEAVETQAEQRALHVDVSWIRHDAPVFRGGHARRQRRDRQKFIDAEMTAHRGDGGSLGAGRLHPPDQAGEDLGLPLGVLVVEIA